MSPDPTLQRYAEAPFAWQVPAKFNIAADVCSKWADGSGRLALIDESADGAVRRYDFDQLEALSDRLAAALARLGLVAGDRIAVMVPQSVETALAHLAGYRSGLIVVPLFSLFGPEAVLFRLHDSGARVLVTDTAGLAKVAAARPLLPALEHVLCVDDAPAGAGVADLWDLLEGASPTRSSMPTDADDPALIIYTSGTNGKPKGALHAHRVLLGHLPGVELSHDGLPRPDDLFWTPADWAWIGGLLDVLLPAWHHGIPVVARRFRKFDTAAALELMRRHRIRNVFLPPTALKQLREHLPEGAPHGVALRSIASGGESLGDELVAWTRRTFGVEVNEFYGQTECNMVVSSCAALYPRVPGSIGKPVPGHAVAVVDDDGRPVAEGVPGHIAVRRPDPVMFLGYWNQPGATADKFVADWLLTGDRGVADPHGYIRFVGRDDDVITSSGYRIGPGPIEDCLLAHPAVTAAAVVGLPDALRTERVTAFVVLRPGFEPSEAVAAELQDLVRERLAAHEYPRDVRFVDALPTTATGKIIRKALRAGAIGGLPST